MGGRHGGREGEVKKKRRKEWSVEEKELNNKSKLGEENFNHNIKLPFGQATLDFVCPPGHYSFVLENRTEGREKNRKEKEPDGQWSLDRQTDRQTDRGMDRRTDGQKKVHCCTVQMTKIAEMKQKIHLQYEFIINNYFSPLKQTAPVQPFLLECKL